MIKFFKEILKTITTYFLKLKKKPSIPDRVVYKKAKATVKKAIDKEEILTKASSAETEEERKEILRPLIEFEIAHHIIEIIEREPEIISEEKTTKKSKKLYNLHEFENEIKHHQSNLALLELRKSSIKEVPNPDTSSFDERINKLFSLLSRNKVNDKVELSDFTVSAFDKDFKQLEKLLTEKSTIKKHETRERVAKENINKAIQKINALILQNNLTDAKHLIENSRKAITNNKKWKKEKKALGTAESKYILAKRKVEIIIKQQQDEARRKKAEEAEKIRIEWERILEQQRLAREQAEANRKIEEAKKQEKEKKLKALLNKKSNWRDFQKVLQENNITILYHFTDHLNLKSIKENGGLYSWFYCDRNNIIIPMTGNSSLGRSLDLEFGLADFVRLSFIKDHPMKHVAMNEGRITRPFLLEVSIEVCYFENTRFSDMNAADRRHTNDDTVDFLNTLRFDLFHRRYFDLNPIQKKHHQAEVLVKTWIPAEYITNLSEIA